MIMVELLNPRVFIKRKKKLLSVSLTAAFLFDII